MGEGIKQLWEWPNYMAVYKQEAKASFGLGNLGLIIWDIEAWVFEALRMALSQKRGPPHRSEPGGSERAEHLRAQGTD